MSHLARLAVIAAVLPLAGGAAGAASNPAGTGARAAAARAAVPALESCRGTRLIRPRGTVVLACADGNAAIRATSWTAWGHTEARGATEFLVNLCTPTCVASHMRTFRGSTIELLDVKHTAHGALFTRAVIGYTLNGERRTFTAFPPS